VGDDVKESGLTTESIMSGPSRLSTMMFQQIRSHYLNGEAVVVTSDLSLC